MTIADKIVQLRKRQGWSQEELSEQLDVSRQSVSKWEGGLAAPGLDKIVELSRLFGVSTDYLLKDEMEALAPLEDVSEPETRLRQVTMAEGQEFLDVKAKTAKPLALGVMLCILSPVCLLFLSGVARVWRPMNELVIVGFGLLALFAFVVPAVAMFVSCGMKTSKFEYMEKEIFEAAPGVTAMARERMEQDRESHARRNVTGICLCIVSAVPTVVAAFLGGGFTLWGVCATLVIVAAGVRLIVLAGAVWDGYQMLLQEGDYTPEHKGTLVQTVGGIYWCAVTAGYLAYSFYTNRWDISWIVWPVAGVAYGAIHVFLIMLSRKKRQ